MLSAHDPRENMLLGNVYATPTALDRSGIRFEDLDLVEIHEAFAAQVLANLRCFESAEFFKEKLNRTSPLGKFDPEKTKHLGGILGLWSSLCCHPEFESRSIYCMVSVNKWTICIRHRLCGRRA